MIMPFTQMFEELEKAEAFSHRLQRAIKGLDVGAWAEQNLLNLVGAGSTPAGLTMAHMPALKASAALMCSVVEQAYTELASPGTTFYRLTVFDEVGVMSEETPHLAFPALQRAVERVANALELSGVAFPRLQLVYDDVLLLYGQALCWSTGHEQVMFEKVKALNHMLAYEHPFDVEAIALERVPASVVSALCIPASLAGVSNLPWELVNYGDAIDQFSEVPIPCTINEVLRVAEAFSHVLIRDAVFGIADGKPLVESWQCELAAWHSMRIFLDTSIGEQGVQIDVSDLWRTARSWSPNYYSTPFTLD
ncbi:MAG: hypothetical protein EON56_01580 [Alphaproteobacteria bacterium]|nr:MAG: hypothetical protein EON56_01580 [Alphaproteobacteria bacterium]